MEKYDITKTFSSKTFYIFLNVCVYGLVLALVVCGVVWLKTLFFPQKHDNVTNPSFDVKPGGTVAYTVIQNKEKDWEVGAFGGLHNSGNEWFGGVQVKRKF